MRVTQAVPALGHRPQQCFGVEQRLLPSCSHALRVPQPFLQGILSRSSQPVALARSPRVTKTGRVAAPSPAPLQLPPRAPDRAQPWRAAHPAARAFCNTSFVKHLLFSLFWALCIVSDCISSIFSLLFVSLLALPLFCVTLQSYYRTLI